MPRRILCLVALLAFLFPVQAVATPAPEPPGQPEQGPGGRDYRFDAVRGEHFGEQPTGFWLFEPEADPTSLEPLPLVIFLHGFTAVDPNVYRAWLDHLVRRGAVVVYPDYQTADPIGVLPLEFTVNAIKGVRAALAELERPGHAPVDLSRTAIAGHSMGGVLTMNLAALAPSLGLPIAGALMPVEPGGCLGCGGPGDDVGVPYRDLSTIPAETRLFVVVGEDDDFVGESGAEPAWEGTGQIPPERRDYIVLRSDRHGEPPLVADHSAPTTNGPMAETDALDWRGLWKWLDSLMDCAFDAEGCAAATNGGPLQLDMGSWSDGTPVATPLVTDTP